MNMDREVVFSINQKLTDMHSDFVVDIGCDDIGFGEPVYLQVAVDGNGEGTLMISLETSDVESMDGARTIVRYLVDSEIVAKGGVVLCAPIPSGYSRFMRIVYSGSKGGTVTAGLVKGAITTAH